MTELRRRMLEELQLRNYSPNTVEVYIRCVANFAQYFRVSPDRLGPEHIRQYQLFLVQRKKVSWAVFNQTVCALRFFYHHTLHRDWMIEHIPYPRHEQKLPVVLSPAEVAAVFEATRNLKHRTILMTIYAAGLRVSELINLRLTDIDSQRQVICVRQGKGRKDRQVMLSPKLLELLRIYWKSDRPTVWLFPGKPPERPITRETVFTICRQAGEAAHLAKPISPHTLRFLLHVLPGGFVKVRHLGVSGQPLPAGQHALVPHTVGGAVGSTASLRSPARRAFDGAGSQHNRSLSAL